MISSTGVLTTQGRCGCECYNVNSNTDCTECKYCACAKLMSWQVTVPEMVSGWGPGFFNNVEAGTYTLDYEQQREVFTGGSRRCNWYFAKYRDDDPTGDVLFSIQLNSFYDYWKATVYQGWVNLGGGPNPAHIIAEYALDEIPQCNGSPITLNRTNIDHPDTTGVPDTLTFTPPGGCSAVGLVSANSPLTCNDCDQETVGTGTDTLDPPCAYKAIRLCPKTYTVTLFCNKDSTYYDIPAWITEQIVFRTICSNKGLDASCTYAALSPRAFWPGTTWFGEIGPLALTKIGADWNDIEGRNQCTQAVPCSWSDSTYSNTIGVPSWTDCNGSNGAAICLPYYVGYPTAGSTQPSYGGEGNIALMLDPEAGTITPTNWFEAVGLPTFPSYVLKPGTTWDCHGCNKFIKVPAAVGTGSGTGTGVPDEDGWGMPELLEIVPVIEDARIACEPTEADPCSPTLTTEDNKCGYDTKAHRSECCDNCCEQLPPQPLFLRCGECSAFATVTPTIGGGNGLDGVDSPVGPTYGASLTGCGYTLYANWYCRGGVSGWAADVYIDGDLCETVSLTHRCCPLALGTGTVNCLPDCEVCIGEPCCDPASCDSWPDTMTITFSGSACFSGSITITRGADNQWFGDELVGGRWSIGAQCSGSTWAVWAIDGNSPPQCYVSAGDWLSGFVECNPVSITFGTEYLGDLGGCECIGDGVTVSITA